MDTNCPVFKILEPTSVKHGALFLGQAPELTTHPPYLRKMKTCNRQTLGPAVGDEEKRNKNIATFEKN